MAKLSIVIPVYNEVSSVLEVLNSIEKLNIDKEIIVVDDGSTDGTRDILKKYESQSKLAKVILMEKNGGKGTALREGFKYVTGDYTVVQDADFEYDPNDLIRMFDYALTNNADVVYGNRFAEKRFYKGMDWKNFLGNNVVLPITASVLYLEYIPDEATCYKMFKTEILKNIKLECKRFEFCPEVTAKVRKKGYKIHHIPISYYPRTTNAGKKLKALQDGAEAIWTLIKYRFHD
jgi:dolichol-phosphate mannosyltransferase